MGNFHNQYILDIRIPLQNVITVSLHWGLCNDLLNKHRESSDVVKHVWRSFTHKTHSSNTILSLSCSHSLLLLLLSIVDILRLLSVPFGWEYVTEMLDYVLDNTIFDQINR